MLYLQELFDDLAHGEFTNMAIGKTQAGVRAIAPDKYAWVISLINTALLDLYARFPLSTKVFDLYQKEGKSLYYLRTDHLSETVTIGGESVTIGGETVVLGGLTLGMDWSPEIYIDGSLERTLNNDIIQLLRAEDALGAEVRINVAAYPNDLFTPEVDIIQVVPAAPLRVFTVTYQAAHPKIVIGPGFNPAVYELYFPSYLKTALLAHVASRLFVGKVSQAIEGQPSLARTFRYIYEQECLRIEALSLVPERDEATTRFATRGWV